MRKTALYVAGWIAAGIGAVTLATAGVSMVGRQVTGERPSSLSAQEVRAELGRDETEPDTSTTAPSSTSTTTPTTTVPGAAAGPGTGSGVGGGAESDTDPSPTGVGSPGPAAVAPGPEDDDGDPVTTSTAAAPSETRTYSMTGGTATLRFSSSGVTVVVATPNAGFSVVQEPTHDNGVRVEFRNDEHRSRVEGWWEGGPRDEVEEAD